MIRLSVLQTRLKAAMGQAVRRSDEDARVYMVDSYGRRTPIADVRFDWQPESLAEAESDTRHPVVTLIPMEEPPGAYAHEDIPHYEGEPAPAELDPITYGILEGLGMYAWWKDGGQYVGTTGSTLRDARARVLRERGYKVSP